MDTSTAHWEHFEHEADVGVRGVGETLDQAFEQAALGMTAIVADPSRIRARKQVRIRCDAPDPELLLVDWLNQLIYEMATRRMLFAVFHVHIHGYRLEATAAGEPVDSARHRPVVEIKGATYTELRIGRGDDGLWRAQCVLDV